MEKEDNKIAILVQNSIALQKAVTALALSLDKFTKQTGNLLQFLSESAKTFEKEEKERGSVSGPAISGEFARKVDSLLEQNKTIAKSIVLLEDYLREKMSSYKS
jgi:hypothetical protein